MYGGTGCPVLFWPIWNVSFHSFISDNLLSSISANTPIHLSSRHLSTSLNLHYARFFWLPLSILSTEYQFMLTLWTVTYGLTISRREHSRSWTVQNLSWFLYQRPMHGSDRRQIGSPTRWLDRHAKCQTRSKFDQIFFYFFLGIEHAILFHIRQGKLELVGLDFLD